MLSKQSEDRYRVEIDYTTTHVRVSCKRGTETESFVDAPMPSFIEKLVGISFKNTVRMRIKYTQDKCNRLNDLLDDMKAICEEAEKEILSRGCEREVI